MSLLTKGLVIAAAQVALAASVGAKFLWDRANYPRAWVETAPYDPDLPIRGRYVRIAVVVHPVRSLDPVRQGPAETYLAHLEVRDGKLYAIEDNDGRHWVNRRRCGDADCWQLSEALAYFIPEDAVDPSTRPRGERLWVEVTVPPEGPPRPIRLGVTREGDGEVTPLEVQ
ncbi:MAG: hypothetical protein ACT4UP_01665 [Gammaproteobacteria bacterium]